MRVRILHLPDKASVAEAFTRVLRPGSHVGVTDVTLADGGLPEELITLTAWAACVADAQPVARYTDILAVAGLRTLRVESNNNDLARMIEQIEAGLTMLRTTAADRLAGGRGQCGCRAALHRLGRAAGRRRVARLRPGRR
jgi:hypothetical protein